MSGEYGLDARWKTSISCKCGGNILAFPTAISEKYANYGFRCNSCGINGSWRELAIGYFEARDGSRKITKKTVAPREF